MWHCLANVRGCFFRGICYLILILMAKQISPIAGMAMMLHRIFAIFIATSFWGIKELFHARQEFVCRNTVAAVVSQRRRFGGWLEWGSDV